MYQTQTDANKGAAIKAFLNYIYKEGQKLADVGRLRAAAEGAAEAGEGAGQARSPSRHRDLGRVAHGTGAPHPSRAPARDLLVSRRVRISTMAVTAPPREHERPAPAPKGLGTGPRPPGVLTDRLFRWIALASGLLVLVDPRR